MREQTAAGNVPADERPLVVQVSRTVRTLTTEVQGYADLVCRSLGINRTDLTALAHLERSHVEGHSMTQADLGRVLHMSGASITALADRLERTGHLQRTRSDHDRRKILLQSTDHARDLGWRSFWPLAQATHRALAGYSDQELELVARVIEDLATAVREVTRDAWAATSAAEPSAAKPSAAEPSAAKPSLPSGDGG